jgi:glycosyltransferase involved in cell wall biosynthesis
MRDDIGSVLGVSFDGLSISGIVNEFENLAMVFRADGYRILLDIGSDITLRPDAAVDMSVIPAWVTCVRSAGAVLPEGYGAAMVDDAAALVARGTPVSAVRRYSEVARELAAGIVATMEREAVRVLVVENGTLPDNPLFTEALYIAIEEYGARQALGKYVLWRDHDLMWSTEPHLYGPYPYPGVRRPTTNKHIHHSVATDWMRRRFEAWANVPCQVIPNRFFSSDRSSSRDESNPSLRVTYGIPLDALLIARCTRIIPQKSVERDLHLIDALQRHLALSGDRRQVYLFVTGPVSEEPAEFRRLEALAEGLGIAQQIVWANGLLPMGARPEASSAQARRYSVGDLLAEADLSSFLTTYDYEGFGNPPGEAMVAGVPYIVTSYELYHDVYGSKGAVAPILSIERGSPADQPMPEYFRDWVLRALTNREYRELVVARNSALCERFFSLNALAEQLHVLFVDAFP